jgi:3'-5' exoribonuclease
VNDVFTEQFLVKQIRHLPNHLVLILQDKDSRSFDATIIDNIERFLKMYKAGDKILCTVKKLNETTLQIIKIKTLSKEMLIDYDKLIQRFNFHIENVKDLDYSHILNEIFSDEIKELFFVLPASLKENHSYKSGLLQHTLEVVDMAVLFAKNIYELDTDLLITGCLLHDIGKLQSFDIDGVKFIETEWESLIGSSMISALYVSKVITKKVDSNKVMRLYHLILGISQIECKIKEAFILRQANEISKNMNVI